MVNCNFKFAPKQLVPSEEAYGGWICTLDGVSCRCKVRASYSEERYRDMLDEKMREYYGMSFDEVHAMWVRRLGHRPLGAWCFIELERC